MEQSTRFTACEGGARLAAAASAGNTLATEYSSFISTRLLHEEGYSIRGPISKGYQRSVYVTRPSRVPVVAHELSLLTDLTVTQSVKWEDVDDWTAELDVKQVVVCISAVLQRLLSEQILNMSNVNVLVLDSCHLISNDHNLKYIMHHYKQCEEDKKPRILALTYPLFQSINKDNFSNTESSESVKNDEHKAVSEKSTSVVDESKDVREENKSTSVNAGENNENTVLGKEIGISDDKVPSDFNNDSENKISDVTNEFKKEKKCNELTDNKNSDTNHDGNESKLVREESSILENKNDLGKDVTDAKDAKNMATEEKSVNEKSSTKNQINNPENIIQNDIQTNNDSKIGVYENYDDFDMYEKLEWKIEELENELCCKMDLAEDIDGGKRFSGMITKPKEVIVEYSPPPNLDEMPELYVQLDKYMRETVHHALHFVTDHRYDPTEIYGEEMYEEFKDIPDPTADPKLLFQQFIYVLDQFGPYAADKAAFTLLSKLEKLKMKVPYERHFLLLCLCTSVFVKIRCHTDYVLSTIESDWEKIKLFSTPKVLRFAEILEKFNPNETANNKPSSDKNDMLKTIDSCDFVTLSNKIEDKINICESNLKDLSVETYATKYETNSQSLKVQENLQNEMAEDISPEQIKDELITPNQETKNVESENQQTIVKVDQQRNALGFHRQPRNRGRGRSQRHNSSRVQQSLLNSDALCGIVFMQDPLVAKIMFLIIVDMSRSNSKLSYLSAQYCADTATTEPKECIKQGNKQEDVLKKFRMHECNLLLATPALEEGIDLPRCNLVIRWDVPASYRSYGLCRSRARAPRAACAMLCHGEPLHTARLVRHMAVYRELDQIISRKCGCGVQDEPAQHEEDHADRYTYIVKPYTHLDSDNCQNSKRCHTNILTTDRKDEDNYIVSHISFDSDTSQNTTAKCCHTNTLTIDRKDDDNRIVTHASFDSSTCQHNTDNYSEEKSRDERGVEDNNKDFCVKFGENDKIGCGNDNNTLTDCNTDSETKHDHVLDKDKNVDKSLIEGKLLEAKHLEMKPKKDKCLESKRVDDKPISVMSLNITKDRRHNDEIASVDLSTAIALVNRYCAKLPSDTFTRLAPQWWMETVRFPTGTAHVCTLRLPLNCPVKYNIVGHPMPTRVLARRMVALQACRILHKSGELDNQLLPIGKENFKAADVDCSTSPLQHTGGGVDSDPSDLARPGTTKRRQYYYKRTAWAFTDCQPVVDTSDTEIDPENSAETNIEIDTTSKETRTKNIKHLCATEHMKTAKHEEINPAEGLKEKHEAHNEEAVENDAGKTIKTDDIAEKEIKEHISADITKVKHESLNEESIENNANQVQKTDKSADKKMQEHDPAEILKDKHETLNEEAIGNNEDKVQATDNIADKDMHKENTDKHKQKSKEEKEDLQADSDQDQSSDSECNLVYDEETCSKKKKNKYTGKRNMLYAIVSSLWCSLPERYNTRGRRLHSPQHADQAIGVLMARYEPDSLQIPAFPVYTRSGEVRVSIDHVPDADVRISPRRGRLIRRFMRFVFAEVLRVRRRGMSLQAEATYRNDYYIVPTVKLSQPDGTTKIDIDWAFLEVIYRHTEEKKHSELENPMWNLDDEENDSGQTIKKHHGPRSKQTPCNPLLKEGETFVFDPDRYKEAVVTPWYRNQDQPQFFLVAEICWNLTPDSAFPSATHTSFRHYYNDKYGVTLTQSNQPLLDVDHTSARLNLLTPRYVNRKGVALPVSSERTRRAKRDRLDQKQILVPELCRVHPFAAPLWFATVALPCVLYRINALLIADEIRRSVAIAVGLGIPKIEDKAFHWPPLDFGWSLAEVLDADSEKNKKDHGSVKITDTNAIQEAPSDGQLAIDNNAEDTKEKTLNDILQETEATDGGFEIGTWSNEMASSVPEDVAYDEYSEPLPPNLTFCTSASGGTNWCEPIQKPKNEFNPTRHYAMADSDDSFMTSDLDTEDSDMSECSGYEDDTSGFGSSKKSCASMGVRIEYKTAHEAEAVDLEKPLVNPSPQPDAADDELDRRRHEASIRDTQPPKQHLEKFHCAVEKHKKDIIESGCLIQKHQPILEILPETHEKLARNDNELEKMSQKFSLLNIKTNSNTEKQKYIDEMFPFGKDELKFYANGQIDLESLERNKRKLLDAIKNVLPDDEIKKLNCFSMNDVNIDSPEYVNEKVVNVGFIAKEAYEKKVNTWGKETDYTPYYEDRKGKKFNFDHQPKLERHPGPSPSVILQALTMSNANDGINLERLETIGDSFLKFAITAFLYCAHPTVHEGKLSHMRSKQVSNLNLYRLGRNKRLGARMIASKFEPHDNWLPPCHRPPPTLHPKHTDDPKEQPTLAPDMPQDSTGCFIPYNLITQHSIPDKSIADCVEALIGAYLLECGPRGALLFMSWLGIKVLPRHEIQLSDDHPYVVRQREAKQKPMKPPRTRRRKPRRKPESQPTDPTESEDSEPCDDGDTLEEDWTWPGRPVGTLQPIHRDGKWIQPIFGELKAPPSPLLRHISDPEGELERMLSGYDALEERLQYRFKDRSLLLQAVSHASHQPNRLTDCYQRLEFLGDAILDYLITRHLYEDPRCHSPGALTDLRSALVNNTIFATLAARIGLHKFFRHMSPGLNEVLTKYVKIQEENGHSISEEHYLIQEDEMEQAEDVEVPKALGDLFESVAGAIFLDSGMSLQAVWDSYVLLMGAELEAFSAAAPKSPVRELLEAEPDTAKFGKPERLADGRRVRVCVEVFGRGTFKGIGRNYRIAKGTAARCALRHLKIHRT